MWDKFKIPPGKVCHRQIGPLKVWLKRSGDELLIASDHVPQDKESLIISELEDIKEVDLEWQRWVTGTKCDTLRLSPIMPDRPVVVKPESPLKITTGAEALFFVLVPVWVQVNNCDTKEALIHELPTVIMSNTWFGEPHEGELCYALKTSARRKLDDLPRRAHQAVCPVQVKNTSSQDLEFTRLNVQVGHLSVYQAGSQLWTEKIQVQFKGTDKFSQIRYSNTPYEAANASYKIGQPRIAGSRNLARKSFDTFRFFSGV